jgi:6-pyruvoyl-tetrahydropterin synthase
MKYKYEYLISSLFLREHWNPPFYEDWHKHDFKVEIELKSNISNIKSYYSFDTVVLQKYLANFLDEIPYKINEHKELKKTTCSTEAISEYIANNFFNYLKSKKFKINAFVKSINIWEGPCRLTKYKINKEIILN